VPKTFVSGHFREGRWVRPHFRNTPGAARLPSLRAPRRRRGGTGLGLLGITAVALGIAALGATSTPTTPAVPTPSSPSTTAPAPRPRSGQYIVQFASTVHPQQAQHVAAQLRAKGWTNVGVLRSDRYPPLRPGYWVTYIGPYPATHGGEAKARDALQRLPGALLRRLD
jgi:hypothetical protein